MGIKISNLPSATVPLTGSELVPVVQGGVTSKAQIFDLLSGSNGSASVGFVQSGTGATSRTTQAKLRDVVSVKDFGAVGDGVTNDAAAIQAAAAAVGSAFLSGTAAKVVFMGPWTQNRNNDANSLAVEAAIQAAAASLDQARVGFIPVCSGSNPWVKGQGDNDTAPNGTSIAYGNSAIVTGNDGVHPYPGRGSEYLARKTLDALISVCTAKGW